MRREKTLSLWTRRFLLALGAFFFYLFAYAAFLLLERALGGGQAYLWYLFAMPSLFVLFEFCFGFVSYRLTRSVAPELGLRLLALVLSLSVFWGVDLISGRVLVSELEFSLFSLDLIALVLCVPLNLTGARTARFFLRRRQTRSS